MTIDAYEPRRETIGLRGFRPGLTQTDITVTEAGEKLEISNLRRRGTVLSE